MKVKLMYYFSLPLFIPLFRTESSSTWRASTTRRWSTTLFWLTADTHTLTRTHSITATLGDAERGTAYRLASADRNHSCPPPTTTFPSSPLWLREPGSSFVPDGGWTGRQRTRDQQFSLWGCRHTEQQPSALHLPPIYLYLSISAWLLFTVW